MHLGVGAVSRRVIEEAAKLQVPQIVASRRQVDTDGGYTGLNQYELVDLVFRLSHGKTQVVRDHGGPIRGDDLTYFDSLCTDVDAGFDVLHLDVCRVDHDDQPELLRRLVRHFEGKVKFEIGDERGAQPWNDYLLEVARGETEDILYGVISLGGHIREDKQIGKFISTDEALLIQAHYGFKYGCGTKAHNMDWAPNRLRYAGYLDAYNVAPEYAKVEILSWLRNVSAVDANRLLNIGHAGHGWSHWFEDDGRDWDEKAVCGLRYVLEQEAVKDILARYDDQEEYVRGRIREALAAG